MDRKLYAALLDVVGMINSPRYDDILLSEAGISLDRALFPLLVRIDSLGPISIVELADHAGRDHSTVSRQVAKLQDLGLATRETRLADQRVRATSITPEGRNVARALAAARERLFRRILAEWTAKDQAALARLNNKLAESMKRFGQKYAGGTTDRKRPS
jgi:DNA-binding MarR family transcriptional regulator